MMLADGRAADVLASPHPYLFLLAGVLGLMQPRSACDAAAS